MWSVVFFEFRRERRLIDLRAMLVTHVQSLGLRAEQNLYHTIINLRMRVSDYCFIF